MPLVGTVDIAVHVTLRSLLLDTAAARRRIHERRACSARDDHRPGGDAGQSPVPRAHDRALLHRQHRRRHADARARAGASGFGRRRRREPEGDRVLGAVGDAAWVYMDIMEGSYGGRHGRDGMDAVDTLYANTRNNPIEDIESHYPLRVRRYELVTSGAGRGQWRGGLGSIREFEFLADGGFSLEGDGSSVPPPGLFGGGDGAPGSVVMNPGTPREQELPSKIPYRKVSAGELLRLVGPCGGGYGAPADRDPQASRRDAEDGLYLE